MLDLQNNFWVKTFIQFENWTFILVINPFLIAFSFSKDFEIDTVVQYDMDDMWYSYYSQVEDAILAFVIGNQQSIKDIRKKYKDIKEFRENDVPYNIAVNNSDLKEENRNNIVPVEEYSKLEKNWRVKFLKHQS